MNPTDGTFDVPQQIDDVLYAFPARVLHLMPAYEDIEDDLKRLSDPWHEIATHWMFHGLPPESTFAPKDGIDPRLALRHAHTILKSYEPKVEHKLAGVAWLLHHWFVYLHVPREGNRPDITAGTHP